MVSRAFGSLYFSWLMAAVTCSIGRLALDLWGSTHTNHTIITLIKLGIRSI